MGKQSNKAQKRQRRKSYIKRKATEAKAKVAAKGKSKK
jgi:hypothetical protein